MPIQRHIPLCMGTVCSVLIVRDVIDIRNTANNSIDSRMPIKQNIQRTHVLAARIDNSETNMASIANEPFDKSLVF